MLRQYTRLLTRLHNTPLLMEEAKLDLITQNVTLKLLQNLPIENDYVKEEKLLTFSSDYPIIKVFDSLVSKNGAGASGFTSYDDIKKQVTTLANAGVTKIGFYHASPGGEAASCDATAEFIYNLYHKYGIDTFAFTDDMSTSASYWLSSATNRIYSTPTAVTGSVGAVLTLIDQTERDIENGITYHILRSKSEKALYNPHEKLSEEVLASAKKNLDFLDNIFNNAVIKYRPKISLQTLLDLNGKTVFAEDALKLGLIDYIVPSIEDVISKEFPKPLSKPMGKKPMDIPTLQEQLSAAQAENLTLKAAATELVKAERTRCLDILAAGATLGVSSELINARISKGDSVEASKEIFLAVKSAIDAAVVIPTSNLAATTPSADTTNSNDKLANHTLNAGFSIRDMLSAKPTKLNLT